ncbi:MAG: MFS transporter, partial [Pseudomonadota bacterium]
LRMNHRLASTVPPSPTVIAVVTATTAALAGASMSSGIFAVIAPSLARDLGVPAWLIGYQVSITYGTAMLTTLLFSGLIAHYGACRMTQVGLALCIAAMLLTMTSSLTAIVIASILVGAGTSVMNPAAAHLLYRFSPPQNRNLIFSIKQTGVPLGWLVIGLTAPGITLALGWPWALALLIVIKMTIVLAMQPVRAQWDGDRDPATARTLPFAGLLAVWRLPPLRWLSFASFCYTFVQLCLGTFLVTMMVEEADYTLVAAGLLLSLTQVSGVAGRITWGWLTDRTGDGFGMLLALNLVMVVCCALTVLISPQWPAFALALLFIAFGASAVGWNGIYVAEVARNSPHGMVSVMTASASVWNYAGILIGPAAFATLYRSTGSYTITFGWLTVIAVLGLAFISAARRAAR